MTASQIQPSCPDQLQSQSPLFLAHSADLAELAVGSRRRRLAPRAGLDFSSNDYLGLSQSAELANAVACALDRAVPLGSGGSRLLRGNHEEHEQLEQEAARFFACESALFFASGYAANSALLSTLPQRGDLVIYDALIHASAHEGLRLSRAEALVARHNDVASIAKHIRRWRSKGGKGRIWIAVESLYSMDGDIAPLRDLLDLADSNDAILLVDEAHATGVYGASGEGLATELMGRRNVITLHTCGKALGCEGALVCGPAIVRDFLINRSRAFIFSTAPSPLMAAAVRASLQIVAAGTHLRQALNGRVASVQKHAAGLGLKQSPSQILPILIGDDARTMEIATRLQAAGFDVRGIRPPTVAAGTSRLRVSISLNVSPAEIEALFGALAIIL